MRNQQPLQNDPVLFQQLLSLLRSALWGEDRFPFHPTQNTDWAAIYQELKHQSVQHIPVDILVRENPAAKQTYIAAAAKNILHWHIIMEQQQQICQLLQEAGIACAVVKGAAAACYYPHPDKRIMGDIDLLVKPQDFQQACQIIAEGSEYLGETSRHLKYNRNGVLIEIHKAFASFRNSSTKELFDQRIFGAIDRTKPVNTENYCFFQLPAAENGLTLLSHIDNHLETGLGLRQILDWMLFVDQELSDNFWQEEFGPFVTALDRKTLAITVTRMCQLYLGLRTDITWCADADENLCAELLEYILNQGNFGRKQPKGSNRAASLLNASGNIFTLFRILQYRGCIKWKALSRYPFLKPFAWLYQIFYYLHKAIRTKHPSQILRNVQKYKDTQNNLMEALGVSRMAEEGLIQSQRNHPV